MILMIFKTTVKTTILQVDQLSIIQLSHLNMNINLITINQHSSSIQLIGITNILHAQ